MPTIPSRDEMRKRAEASIEAQTVEAEVLMVGVDTQRWGAARMRNFLLQKAPTDWVAFLDDDDELLPNHIEELWAAHLNRPEVDLWYPWFEPVNMEDPLACPVNGNMVNPFGVPFGEEQKRHVLNVDNFIPVTVMARRDAILHVGGFQIHEEPPTPVRDRDELGCWRALLKEGYEFGHVPVRTWRYHHHPGHTGGYPEGEQPAAV
jgi:hypothetical protein